MSWMDSVPNNNMILPQASGYGYGYGHGIGYGYGLLLTAYFKYPAALVGVCAN